MTFRVFPALLFAAAMLAPAANVSADDWAYWRGPEMNGVSREKNLPDTWSLNDKQNVRWTAEIGGRAAPVIFDGRVYLNCRTSEDVSTGSKELIDAQEQVICWDLKTGKELWKDRFNVFETDIPAARVGWASMTVDPESGFAYVHTVSGLLRCYTPDGKHVWEHSLQEEYGEITGYGGRLVTPIIDEDRLIVAFPCLNWGSTGNPPPKHTFYAFDRNTGTLLWTAAPGGAIEDTIYTCPIIAVIGGVRQLISGNGDGGCYGINARTGETLWGFKMSKRGVNVSPVVDGNHVFISHGEDNIDGTDFGRVQCIDATLRGDITATGSVWRVDGVKAGYASPALHDGVLYVVTDTGQLIAFDTKDGKQLWKQTIGTVGKGSPVWADGKIYVMEVNGRIGIYKVGREKCETLSEVQLFAGEGAGTDEIYGSPAISNGCVVFTTRDRTICIAKQGAEVASDPVPPLPEEQLQEDKVASIKVIPYEVSVQAGEKIEYEVRGYDKNGRFLRTIADYEITASPELEGLEVKEHAVTTAKAPKLPQAGTITIKAGDLTATARIRSFPPLPWNYDFEGLSGKETPAGWVNAPTKLVPIQMDGNTVMKSTATGAKGKPAFSVWLGPPEMRDYTVQVDVLVEGKRRLSNIGVTVNRYDMVLSGNTSRLSLTTWPAHLRINENQKLDEDPAGKWYTMKFAVQTKDGQAMLRGKLWPRGEDEPQEWTIETVDPHANVTGSPGLFVYRLADAYYDNVVVAEFEE